MFCLTFNIESTVDYCRPKYKLYLPSFVGRLRC